MDAGQLQRNFQSLFYGLSAAWVGVAIYAVYLFTRSRGIARQIETLKAMAQQREKQ